MPVYQVDISAVMHGLPSEEELVAKCMELGLTMRRAPMYEIVHPALTLFPSQMRRSVLRELYDKQRYWNEAIDRTARNFAFLQEALRETAASDTTFTGKLVEMLGRVYMSPPALPEAAKYPIPHPVFQPAMLGIFRTDYMRAVDGKDGADTSVETAEQWKNVEINTVSCSFAGLSPLVGDFHEYLRQYRAALLREEHDDPARGAGEERKKDVTGRVLSPAIEHSTSGDDIPAALAEAVAAWRASVPFSAFSAHYAKKAEAEATSQDPQRAAAAIAELERSGRGSEGGSGASSRKSSRAVAPHHPPSTHLTHRLQPIVLVVVQEGERNTGDQYKLLFTLLKRHGIVSIRRTLAQLHETTEYMHFSGPIAAGEKPSSETSKYNFPPFAVIEKRFVAAVVYFRSTYAPEDFPTPACWRSREDLERCNAIKCPSLPYHLMTFKKLQQLFCFEDTVLVPVAFKGNAARAKAISTHFMGQHSLNVAEYDAAAVKAGRGPEHFIQAAIDSPDKFVLKPQLEGGGNLIAGEEMQEVLRSTIPATHPYHSKIRKEFILMEKINYEKKDGLLFREGKRMFFKNNTCSELGIFGCILSDGSEAVYADGDAGGNKSSTAGSRVFNRCGGYVVRTKPANAEDGGVMAGVACLDNMEVM